jgi:hypothetical protein
MSCAGLLSAPITLRVTNRRSSGGGDMKRRCIFSQQGSQFNDR